MSFNKAEDFVRAVGYHAGAREGLRRAIGTERAVSSTRARSRPFGFHEAGAPPKSYVQFPGVGSPNWGGTAADPTTGYVYVGTSDSALTGWIEKKVPGRQLRPALTDGSPLPMDRGSVNGPGPYNQFSAGGMPCQRPPWATRLRH